MINKGGRPIPDERSTEKLRQFVLQYKEKHGIKKITFSGLEKEYKIKRYIWRDREEINLLINELNKVDLGLDNINILKYNLEVLPNLEELLDKYQGDKKRTMDALQMYDDFVKGLYERCCEYLSYKIKYEDSLVRIEELIREIKNLKSEAEHYKKEYYNLVVDSNSKLKRNEKGIVKKVIQINRDELKSDFDDLF